PQIFYYRKSMLEKAKVDVPTTLDELIEAAAKHTTSPGAGPSAWRSSRRGAQPACCRSCAERWVRGARRPRCSRSVVPVYSVR
ncbi:extracellular solute-binding protein, partial [Streptomyces sp. NPDC002172]